MTAEELAHLLGATRNAHGWSARCPAHDDHVASLSIAEGDEQPVVVHCHAGCRPDEVMKALGLTMADLQGEPRLVAEYPYHDAHGALLYTVQRWTPKTFRTVPAGIPPATRTLYQREAIEWARANSLPLYLVEGEKDVETLREVGVPATTAPHGAKADWLPQYTGLLTGCHVVIVADNDVPGVERARTVFDHLTGHAASVSLVRPTHGKDVTDLLEAGYGLEQLEPISEGHRALTSVRALEVQEKRINWAWQDRIPFGAMTLLDGDPGSAKSVLTVDLVARWTSGRPMPDDTDHAGPHDAVMVSAEDDPAATIVPRLRVAGADLGRVHLVTGGIREDLPFNLSVDLTALREMVITTHSRYLVLDPLSAFMPSTTDSKMDAAVRTALAPLQHMARQLGFALVVVRHLTKSGSQAMYAGSGSVGYIASARTAYLITSDPTKGPAYRVLAPIKNNLASLAGALSYTVEPAVEDAEVPRLHWHGEVEWTAQDLLDRQRGATKGEDTELIREAKAWLRATVTPHCLDGGIGLKWAEIVKRARDEGEFSEIGLRRARPGVLVKHYNPVFMGVPQTGCYWRVLPYDDATAEAAEGLQLAQDAQLSQTVDLAHPALRFRASEQVEQVESPSTSKNLDWLRAQPDACDYPNCPVEGLGQVIRCEAPHWCVRCVDHLPDAGHKEEP